MADIFDESLALCRQIENDLGRDKEVDDTLHDLLNSARIMDLTSIPKVEEKGKEYYGYLDELYNPFGRTVFILSKELMILVCDSLEKQIGVEDRRLLVMFDRTDLKIYSRSLSIVMYDFKCEYRKGNWEALFGAVSPFIITSKNRLRESFNLHEDLKSQDRKVRNFAKKIDDRVLNIISSLFMTWGLINRPDYFIMERTIDNIPKNKRNSPKLKRRYRPNYTILKADNIRREMGLPIPPKKEGLGKGGTKRPHDRRRHTAFLSHDKYKYDRDGKLLDQKVIPYGPRKGELYYKKVDIPAVWVGESQNVVGKHRYRVLLNR